MHIELPSETGRVWQNTDPKISKLIAILSLTLFLGGVLSATLSIIERFCTGQP